MQFEACLGATHLKYILSFLASGASNVLSTSIESLRKLSIGYTSFSKLSSTSVDKDIQVVIATSLERDKQQASTIEFSIILVSFMSDPRAMLNQLQHYRKANTAPIRSVDLTKAILIKNSRTFCSNSSIPKFHAFLRTKFLRLMFPRSRSKSLRLSFTSHFLVF